MISDKTYLRLQVVHVNMYVVVFAIVSIKELFFQHDQRRMQKYGNYVSKEKEMYVASISDWDY